MASAKTNEGAAPGWAKVPDIARVGGRSTARAIVLPYPKPWRPGLDSRQHRHLRRIRLRDARIPGLLRLSRWLSAAIPGVVFGRRLLHRGDRDALRRRLRTSRCCEFPDVPAPRLGDAR